MRNNADVRVRNGAWSWIEGVLIGCGMTALATGRMSPTISGLMVLIGAGLIIMLMAIPVTLAILGRRYADEEQFAGMSWPWLAEGGLTGISAAIAEASYSSILTVLFLVLAVVGVLAAVVGMVSGLHAVNEENRAEVEAMMMDQFRSGSGLLNKDIHHETDSGPIVSEDRSSSK